MQYHFNTQKICSRDLLGNGKSYKDSLTVKNYVERFHLLLYLEESQMNVDIREYDRTNQVLEKHGTKFYLEVSWSHGNFVIVEIVSETRCCL